MEFILNVIHVVVGGVKKNSGVRAFYLLFSCVFFGGAIGLEAQHLDRLSPPPSEAKDTLVLGLEDAKRYALEHGYRVRQSAYELEQIEYKSWEILSIGFPKVSGEVRYTYAADLRKSRLPANIFDKSAPEGRYINNSFGVDHDIQLGVNASQLIFDASYIIAAIALETTEVFSKNKKSISEAETLKATALAYISILIARENIEILKKNLRAAEGVFKDTRQMFLEGLVEEQDVQQLQISTYEITTSLLKLKRMLENNYDLLKLVSGIPLNTPVEVSDSIGSVLEGAIDFSVAFAMPDVSNNIDVQLSNTLLQLSELDYESKISEYFPKLSAFMAGGYNTGGNEFDITSKDVWLSHLSVGLSLKVPISDVFLTTNFKVQQAQIDYEKSQLENYEMKQKVTSDLKKFRNEYLNNIDLYNTSMRQMELAQSIYQKERVKYTEGIGSSFNLSQSQTQLYQKQQNYLNAIYRVIQSKLDLERLLR